MRLGILVTLRLQAGPLPAALAAASTSPDVTPSRIVAIADVFERFPVDTGRIYTGGMSGGARVEFSSLTEIVGVYEYQRRDVIEEALERLLTTA